MSRENHIYEPDWSGRTDQLCSVNKPVIKKDALALVTGKPVYVDDLVPKDCLIVKVLRSPHANAIVKSVKKTAAERVPGIEAIYTWEDVPKQRFTMAGQTYPEPSPYDRLILDQHVRYVGDPVAIIAGKDEKCVDRARKLTTLPLSDILTIRKTIPATPAIPISPRIMNCWCIRRKAGNRSVRSVRTIREISVQVRKITTEMWKPCSQSAMRS